MSFRFFSAAMLLFALAGCSQGVDNDRIRADIISDDAGFSVAKLPINLQSAHLRAATAQGLVTFDPQGRVVPALASRWMQTDNGLSYIFRLNKARWNNGVEVKAEAVADALNARLAELRGAGFQSALGNIIRVERMTGRVIQFRLRAPMPHLLEYLAKPEFGIVYKGNGAGPMMARSQGNVMVLRLREEESIDEILLSEKRVFLSANRAAAALARLKNGDSDIAIGGDFADLPMVEAAEMGGVILDAEAMVGQFGLLLQQAGPFLANASNVEAIAMAIDRPRILTAFSGVSWKERIALVQENIDDRGNIARPGWAALNMNDRKSRARATIAAWKAANGNVRPLRIAMPQGPGARILFAWLRADLVQIGLDAKRVGPGKDADLRLVDRLADSSSAAWFLEQLSCARTAICSAEADALVAEGRSAVTQAERKRLFGEAEAVLLKKRNFIPIASPLRWSAYREGLRGYTTNLRGWHYLQYLGRDPT